MFKFIHLLHLKSSQQTTNKVTNKASTSQTLLAASQFTKQTQWHKANTVT